MKITTFFIALSLMLPCLEASGQEDFALQAQWFPIRQLLWETYPFLKPYSPVVAIVSNDKGKFNLVNEQGKRLCNVDYDYIQPLSSTTGEISKRFFLVSSAEAEQVLDDKGNQLPLPDFQSCYYNSSLNAFILKRDDYYGMADIKGHLKLPFRYTSLHGDEHHIVASTDGVHYGTISSKGKTRIPPRLYKEMWPLPFGFLCISNGEGKAVLDSSGRQLCDFQFYEIWPLPSGGYFASLSETPSYFRQYDKDFHLLNGDIWLLYREQDGDYIFCLPNKERCLMYHSNGSLIYESAINNTNGQTNVNPYEPSKEAAAWAKQHSCTVLPNGCYNDIYEKRVLGPDKKVVFEYESPIRYTLDGFFIQDKEEETLLDIHGKVIMDFPYTRDYWFCGIMLVNGPNGKGQLKADGSFVLPATFQNLEVEMNNNTRWIRVKQNDLFGMADLEGHILIHPAFNAIEFCRPHHWLAEKKDSTFVFDTKGHKIAQYGKDDCRSFKREYIIVKKNGHWGIQDAVGKELAPFIYDCISNQWDIVSFSHNAKTVTRLWTGSRFQDVGPGAIIETQLYPRPDILLRERGKFGVYKRSGEVILPAQYDQIINENENLKVARQGNICHLLDASFTPTFTFQADSLLALAGKNLVFCIRSGQRYLVNMETGAARACENQKVWIARDVVWFYQGNSGLVLSLRTLREILPFEVEVTQEEYGQQVYVDGIYLFRKNGKAGLIDTSGTLLVPFEMDEILIHDKCARFWLGKNGMLYGTYHISTREFTLLNVEIKENAGNQGWIVKKGDLLGYLNKNLEISIPISYQTLYTVRDSTFLATKADLYGVISENNKVLIPFEYGSLIYNRESKTWVGQKPVPTDIIQTDGTIYSIPSNYNVHQIKGSWAVISSGKNYQGEQIGLFSFKTGKMVLPAKYQSVKLYENDFAVVSQTYGDYQYDIKYQGLLDSLGRWVIPLDSLQLVSFAKEAIVAIDRQGRYGLFDWMGHLILPFEWESLSAVEDKPIIASKKGQYQMLRPDGTPLTRFPYDYMGFAWNEPYSVRRGKWWGYLNDQGEEVIALQYLYADNFGNGRIATVLTDSGYCAISGLGNEVKINNEDLQFPELKVYNEKVKPTCNNCVYDVWGRLLLTLEGVKLWGTANGLLVFSTDTTASEPLKGVMDLSGKVLCPALYDEINLGNMLHAFRKGNLWGYMDTEGVVQIAPQFDMAGSFNSDRLASVKKDGRHFYINRKGECEKNCP